MGEPFSGMPPPVRPPDIRLDSWKEIAAYLHRDMKTVQRWEKREGMPVHRHLHDKVGSVYAFGSELDGWLQNRRLRSEEDEKKAVGDPPVDAAPARAPGKISLGAWLASGAVALVSLLAVTYVLTRAHARDLAQTKISSLAVLPLRNLSGDPTQDYFADGMTEAVIARLSRIHDLRVISRTSVMHLRDTHMSVPEIAKTLHVDAIVEGSVIRDGGRVRVNAQLIRGASDDHFWSETYDREVRDTLALESDVAQAIARKVEVTVTGEEHERLTAVRPVAPEVYESYLRGESALDESNGRREGVDRSIAYFEEALKRDPTFAPAYVGLATAYAGRVPVFAGAPPGPAREKAISAARKALELDSQLAEAHLLLGRMLQGQYQWAESEAEYRRALELQPSSSSAQSAFAHWLLSQGRIEEALSWTQRAREHDPLAVSGVEIGWILFHARRYDEATRQLRSVLALDPNEPVALWNLGFVLIANDHPEKAIPILEKAASLSERRPGVIALLIRAYAHAGRRAEALRILAELKQKQKTTYIPSSALVNAYLGLGDNEQAFAWMERAYQEQSNILQLLKVHPYFDPLRGDPRFADLVRRVGLDQVR